MGCEALGLIILHHSDLVPSAAPRRCELTACFKSAARSPDKTSCVNVETVVLQICSNSLSNYLP